MGKISAPCAWCFFVLTKELDQEADNDVSLTYDQVKDYLSRFESKQDRNSDSANGVGSPGVQGNTDPDSEPQDEDARDPASTSNLDNLPLFVTFTSSIPRNPRKLRGCKGTFESAPVDSSVEYFTVQAAFHDRRFRAIDTSELEDLSCSVTLLHGFEACEDPLDWEVGRHGIRVRFVEDGGKVRRATYLPHVARQMGWTREQAIVHAVAKSGSTALMSRDGRRPGWDEVLALDIQLTRYQGTSSSLSYVDWKRFRDWVVRERRDSLPS